MANQMAMTMTATMMAAQTAGVTRFELPLLGESLAAWSNLIWHLHMREIGVGGGDLAERRLVLSQNEASARSPSCFDRAGCAALTGSDAGKLSIRPASSLAWMSRSARAASRGSAACLSCGAGLNFSTMLCLHRTR